MDTAAKRPEILSDKNQMRRWSRAMRAQGKIIALVPTMGYLHEGHLSLIREAKNHADLVVVSIYVNPGQFSPSEDLSSYPSDFDGDVLKLMSIPGGVDAVFHPHSLYDYGIGGRNKTGTNGSSEECSNLVGDKGAVVSCLEERGTGHETWVRVEGLEKGLCGKSRPVFSRGVATIVTKLFNIVEPDVAVLGKKDYQQWRIIQKMVGIFSLVLPSFNLQNHSELLLTQINNAESLYKHEYRWSVIPLIVWNHLACFLHPILSPCVKN